MEESKGNTIKDHFKVPSLLPKGNNDEAKLILEKNKPMKIKDSAEQNVVLPYKEPEWSGTPSSTDYSFEVIKSGVIILNFPIIKSYIVIGRLTTCDIALEHPSVSRYHAIIQYCKGDESHRKGFYVYDLNSTHGTFLNKDQVTPKTYYLIKNGHVLKFGGSTRLHILQGPESDDDEPEIDTKKIEKTDPGKSEEICSWGISEDAAEEEDDDLAVNPFAVSTENEDLYLDDPKKTLRGWFEREGYELEYNVEERGFRTFACTIRLPIDTPTSDFLAVEAAVNGKKKEAVAACALEACRTLDRHGLLRQSHQSSRERKQKNWEDEDFYDSDEDTYLDRTGTIEKKRQFRMMQVKKPEPETFSSLEQKLKELNEKIFTTEKKLQSCVNPDSLEGNKNEEDPLDSYMCQISHESVDKVMKSKLKLDLAELSQEKARVEKLLNIAKPAQYPPVKKFPNMIGKRLKSKLKLPSSKPAFKDVPKEDNPEFEEEYDEGDDNEKQRDKIPKEIVSKNKQETKKNTSSTKDNNFINIKIKTDSLEVESEIISDSTKTESEMASSSVKAESETTSASAKTESEMVLDSVRTKSEIAPNSANVKIEFKIKPENSASKDNFTKIDPLKHSLPSPELSKKPSSKKPRSHKSDKKDVYNAIDENYSMWMPPTNQKGDGSTHLNSKYGY